MKMFNEEIESRLNNVSVKPLSGEEKGIMWSKIEKGIAAPIRSPFWQSIRSPFAQLRLQTSVTVALMVAVLFSGTSVAFAYADSAKPGDMLFPLALVKEKIVISLTPTNQQGAVRLKYAEKRIEQGNEFLTALNTTVITSTSTKALGGNIASSSTSSGTTYSYQGTASSSPALVGNAVNRLSATVAYLQGVKADLLASGNTASAETIQNAIDKILGQVSNAANQNPIVIAKVQEHKNQFNVTVSTTNASTTTTTRVAINTKKDTQKVTITEKDNTQVRTVSDSNKKENEKKNEGKGKNDEHENSRKNDDRDDDKDRDNDDRGGFFEWLGFNKTDICHKGTTINVANSAVKAHLKHGDKTGRCDVSVPPTNTNDTTAPVVSNISTSVTATTAKIAWGTNENATAVLSYGTTNALGTSVNLTSLTSTQESNLSGLLSDTTYYFTIAAKDASGNVTTTAVSTFKTSVASADTTAPVVSNIATTVTPTTAKITWSTNENATAVLLYGTTASFGSSANESVSQLNQESNLSGLTADTTYHFAIVAKDAAGNTSTTTTNTFKTSFAPDTTAPTFSNLVVSSSAGTTNVSWTTNENATGKIYYGTVSPITVAGAPLTIQSGAYTANHTFNLNGLTASTTYYFLLEGKDSAGNTGFDIEHQFTTGV